MDMDSTSSAIALTAVLDVPELLENILSFLPEREILTSVQRVSRTWRSSIAGSPRIQRSLFSPKGNQPAALPAWFSNGGSRSGASRQSQEFDIPMYKGPIASNRFFKKYAGGDENEQVDLVQLYTGCEFELWTHLESNQEYPERTDRYVHCLCFRWSDPVDTGGTPEPAFSSNPDLSWRHMQLCDPPIAVANLHVDSELEDHSADEEYYATIFDRDGITMGLVHDTAAAMIRSQFGEEIVSKVSWSSSVTFGIEGSDEGSETDKPDDSGSETDEESFSEQDDADEAEEEDEDGGVEPAQDDAEEDDSVYLEEEDADQEGESGGGDDENGEGAPASTMEIASMSKVLAIPELLEKILSFLPERQLIASVQRVSRTWRLSVVESPSIQRKLGLPKGKQCAISPISFSLENKAGEECALGVPFYEGPVATNHLLKTRHDPYLGCHLHYWEEYRRMAAKAYDVYVEWEMFAAPTWGGNPAFSHCSDLSWRAMQLCDPPITAAILNVSGGSWEVQDDLDRISATIFDRDGVTLGLVHDTAAAVLRHSKDDSTLGWHLTVTYGIKHHFS
jgi:hypothetical protein